MKKIPEANLRWLLKASTTGTTPTYFCSEGEGVAWFTPESFQEQSILLDTPKKRVMLDGEGVRTFPANSVLVVGIGTIGKLAVNSNSCSGNQQINCLTPDSRLNTRYLAYVLLTKTDEMYALSGSSTLPILNQERMRSLRIPILSFGDQERIANFLDVQTARIDALIAEKEVLADAIDELCLSSINQAVSCGLNSDAILVPTNDAWFEKVPLHWAFCPLNYRYEVQLGKMLDEKRITGKYLLPYLRNPLCQHSCRVT